MTVSISLAVFPSVPPPGHVSYPPGMQPASKLVILEEERDPSSCPILSYYVSSANDTVRSFVVRERDEALGEVNFLKNDTDPSHDDFGSIGLSAAATIHQPLMHVWTL